jgi:hypothetical protein
MNGCADFFHRRLTRFAISNGSFIADVLETREQNGRGSALKSARFDGHIRLNLPV